MCSGQSLSRIGEWSVCDRAEGEGGRGTGCGLSRNFKLLIGEASFGVLASTDLGSALRNMAVVMIQPSHMHFWI